MPGAYRIMSYENIRYHLAVAFMVCGSSIFYTLLLVWLLLKLVPVEGWELKILYVLVYVLFCYFVILFFWFAFLYPKAAQVSLSIKK